MTQNRYAALRSRQQEEFNAFPMKFAFSTQQFAEGMAELGLKPTDTDKIYKVPGGGFYRKTDAPTLHGMQEKHSREMDQAVAEDVTGDGFIYEMFLYELNNHEFGYTGDLEEALDAIPYTQSEIAASPAMTHGLEKAIQKIRAGRDNFDE